MTFEIPDDCKTAATAHPKWWEIYDRLESRFADCEIMKQYAIEMVSSYFMGVRDRYEHAKKTLGPIGAGDVVTICRGFCVDIEKW